MLPKYNTCPNCNHCFASSMRPATVCLRIHWILVLLYQYVRSVGFTLAESGCPYVLLFDKHGLADFGAVVARRTTNTVLSGMPIPATPRSAILSRVRMVLLAHHVNAPCRLCFASRRKIVLPPS